MSQFISHFVYPASRDRQSFFGFNRAPISPAINNQRMEVVSLPLMVPVNKVTRPFPRGPRPLLTLLLLTAIAGGIEADFGCSKIDGKNNDTFFFLSDVECRVSEINAAFNGRLKTCQQLVGQTAYEVSTVACAQHSCKISLAPPLRPRPQIFWIFPASFSTFSLSVSLGFVLLKRVEYK